MKTLCLLCLIIITATIARAQVPPGVESALVLLDVKTGQEQVILRETRHFEAPNWSRDGQYLLINAAGRLEKVSVTGQKMGQVPTGFATRCNNDHGFSFDGGTLIISHDDTTAAAELNSRIFMVPAAGGTPRLVTEQFPSYWHGISPDGQTLLYCAQRQGQWDVYKIALNGGPETRLTTTDGLDDGPEYSPDGQWIYFNSHRNKRMHLYRMRPDGTQQAQLTRDEYDNWFAHPSPDGQSVAYIAYMQDQRGQHPFGRDVKLRLLNLRTGRSRDLTKVFYGGQGSFNVPSWSPDGRRVAYVRYQKP